MTIEQFYDKKEPAPAATSASEKVEKSARISAHDDNITIPTILYTELVRQSALNEAIINVLMSKKVIYKEETLMAILDLPYEEGGDE